ncbi:MAG: lysophospholipid acyltransferase family protein [Bacteroidales bacterium]
MDLFKSIIVWLIGITWVIVLFPLTFIIWLLVLPFDHERRLIHWLLMYQSFFLCRLIPIWTIRIEGRGKALKNTTYVIISNHQSMLDILMINCLRYRFKWVSKIENMKVPVLGWYLRMAKYIIVDRDNTESREEMLEISYMHLKKGMSVMLFPEGTRSQDGELGFFKRGAFQLALETGRPILPILIDGTGSVLPKHGFVFKTGHNIMIRVLDPVLPRNFGTGDPDALAAVFKKRMGDILHDIRKQ